MSGWTGEVLDCLGPFSSAVRQPWCSLERTGWQCCLVLPAPTALPAGCWGGEAEAERGSVASLVLPAGVNKPHWNATKGEHGRGPPARRAASWFPFHCVGGTAGSRQYRGDFGEAEAPVLTHLLLIGTSGLFFFFCKTQAPDLLQKGRWFCHEAGADSSRAEPVGGGTWCHRLPFLPSQGWGLRCRCQAQDLLFGRYCWHLGGFRCLAMPASARPACFAPGVCLSGWFAELEP